MEFAKELDARGLNCPLPILRAKKALGEVESGQVLKILSTDPGSVKDFAAFAKQGDGGVFQHLDLDPGPHQIEIRTPGQPIVFEVNVQPGRTIRYRAGPPVVRP